MTELGEFVRDHGKEFEGFDAYSYLVLAACLADSESKELDRQEELISRLERECEQLRSSLTELFGLQLPEEESEITMIGSWPKPDEDLNN